MELREQTLDISIDEIEKITDLETLFRYISILNKDILSIDTQLKERKDLTAYDEVWRINAEGARKIKIIYRDLLNKQFKIESIKQKFIIQDEARLNFKKKILEILNENNLETSIQLIEEL